jgi:hypothetical protein
MGVDACEETQAAAFAFAVKVEQRPRRVSLRGRIPRPFKSGAGRLSWVSQSMSSGELVACLGALA